MSQGQIYTGPWINFEKGWILGSTLTLGAHGGSLLTSFLAAFITVVASQLWKIISFLIHQKRSSRKSQDGLHHQHQIVFRNTSSPADAAMTFIQQWWAWRGRTRRPFLRSVPWILLTISYVIIFSLLSVFSGEVTKSAGSDRLLVPNDCGYWRLEDGSADETNAQVWKVLNDTITAATYARQCYGGSTDPLLCSTMVQPSLPSTADTNSSCPFAQGSCIWGESAAFSVDSGLIDSRDDLGINAPDSGRVMFRKKTTCAPMVTKGFQEVENSTVTPGSFNMTFYFGPIVDVANFSFEYNTVGAISEASYSLTVIFAMAGFAADSWIPVASLNRTDADVSLIFIAPNSVYYSTPNEDPIFGANTPYPSISTGGYNTTFYNSDHYINVMGCTEQYQFCDPNTGGCTEMDGLNPILSNAVNGSLKFNVVQMGAIQRISNIAASTSIYNIVNSRGASALRASETVSRLEQGPLPSNEWQIEIQSWFDTALAALQQGVLAYATGPQNVLPGSYVWSPTDLVSRAMCHSQLVRSTAGTISFSVLGVSIILAVGFVVIVLAQTVERITAFCQHRFFKKSKYRQLNWVLDDKFQLQRMMYEAVEMGGKWEGTKDSVPVTEKSATGVRFGGWEDIDEEHPSVVLNWRGGSSIGGGGGGVDGGGRGGHEKTPSLGSTHGAAELMGEEEAGVEPERVNLMFPGPK